VSHFGHKEVYRKIITELLSGALSYSELQTRCHQTTGGTFSEKLDDLALAEFIEKVTPLEKSPSSSLVKYRILDEYLHFYSRWILPNIPKITYGKKLTLGSIRDNAFASWRGMAFERFCRRNSELIARILQFAGIDFTFGSWFRRKSENIPGSQIDLLFLRGDKVMTLCEVKYAQQIREEALRRSINKKKQVLSQYFPRYRVQTVLISALKEAVSDSVRKICDETIFLENLASQKDS